MVNAVCLFELSGERWFKSCSLKSCTSGGCFSLSYTGSDGIKRKITPRLQEETKFSSMKSEDDIIAGAQEEIDPGPDFVDQEVFYT